MRRYARLLILGVMVLCLLSGCKQGEQAEEISGPAVGVLRGGIETEQALLSSLEFINADGKTQIVIAFSQKDGSTMDAVPSYTIKTLSSPHRISVEMGAAHRNPDLSGIEPAGDVAGLFLRDSVSADGKSTLFIQLNQPAVFTANEDSNKLTIELMAEEPEDEAGEKYYACVNAYEEYRYADMPPGTNELTPTLCADNERIMLISKPYEKQSDAQAEAERIQNVFNEENAAKMRTAKAVALMDGQRPDYIEGLYESEIFQLKPVLVDGQEHMLPVAMLGGRYLGSSSDGKRLFIEAGFREEGSDKVISETLTILDANHNKQRLTSLTEIYRIEDAGFSPGGNGICILDGTGSATKLYYYNLESRKLLHLNSSELDGAYAFAFADDNTIYTLGESISKVTIDGDTFNADLVVENAFNVNEICCANGQLYYAEYQPSDGEEACGVYALSDDGTKERIADGSRLNVSPDGSKIACIADNPADGNIEISIMEDGAEQAKLTQIAKISGFSWSPDSSQIYYTEPTPEGDYPNTLVRYNLTTGESTSLLGILTGEFYCVEDDIIYIVMVQREGNYTVTFELRD